MNTIVGLGLADMNWESPVPVIKRKRHPSSNKKEVVAARELAPQKNLRLGSFIDMFARSINHHRLLQLLSDENKTLSIIGLLKTAFRELGIDEELILNIKDLSQDEKDKLEKYLGYSNPETLGSVLTTLQNIEKDIKRLSKGNIDSLPYVTEKADLVQLTTNR